MKGSRVTIIAGLLLVLNIGFFALRKRSALRPESREELQADLISNWSEGDWIELPLELTREISRKLISQSCSPSNVGGLGAMPYSQLPVECAEDIVDALNGLILAIQSNRPKLVAQYMLERGEFPAPDYLQLLRDLVVANRQMVESAAQEADYEKLQLTLSPSANTHWSKVNLSKSCANIYLAHNESDLTQFGFSHFKAFPGVEHTIHGFRGDRTMQAQLATGRCIIAEVSLVIALDSECGGIPSPTFIRFWFDDISKRWRPIALARTIIDDETDFSELLF